MPSYSRQRMLYLGVILLAAASACGGSAPSPGAGGPGGRGGAPATAVGIVALAPVSIENQTEFVGTVKSRRSTNVQPQVEGFLTSIAVASGDRVTPGTFLFQIDSTSQQAAVAGLESTKVAREADVALARQQATRVKTLFDAGAASQQEVDQTSAAVKTTEAQLRAIEDQIRLQRNELAYYRVTASTSGVVGDIPVRVGDRVTRTTHLTTIDDNTGMEIYVNVPVQEASRLHTGLTLKVLGPKREVVTTKPLYFVARAVDETQTILAKAELGPQSAMFRAEQFVTVSLVWSEAPSLVVPLVAVSRIGGQFFVFVAEAGQGGGLVARMRPVTLGAVVGNNYVVLDGLKPGEKLITSGVQKIGDGAPVTQAPPAAPAAAGRQGGEAK